MDNKGFEEVEDELIETTAVAGESGTNKHIIL